MAGYFLAGLDRRRLGLWLALFFLALAIPTGILIRQAYSQLKWEAFHRHRLLAEELATRTDGQFIRLIEGEDARSFADYGFLVILGDPSASFLQRSPLSAFPVESDIPGLIGYFQVDDRGAFSTPLVPQSSSEPLAYGISRAELGQRRALAGRLERILSRNQLVQGGATVTGGRAMTADSRQLRQPRPDKPPLPEAEENLPTADADDALALRLEDAPLVVEEVQAEAQAPGQAAFDRLIAAQTRPEKKKQQVAGGLGRVEDLKLDHRYQVKPAEEERARDSSESLSQLAKRSVRKERTALPEPQAPIPAEAVELALPAPSAQRIRIFESEIDPFEFSLLASGDAVLFRKVWRDGQRYIQGALIERQPFFQRLIESAFRETALSQMSDLIVAYQGDVLSAVAGASGRGYLSSAEDLSGALLYRTRLSAPFSDLELIFSITRLPAGPGARLITWVAAILAVVLCGGFYLMYRLGVVQINLVRQQQDFVSAVSHELKTPLTSIRLYGEMLREGWVADDKKMTYYDYIHGESERLSRLINNVLQLARMTRNDLQVHLQSVTVAELMDTIRSTVSSQVERSGFELRLDCSGDAESAVVNVDTDCFTQIIINLVDNGIKFSAKAALKRIDIGCRPLGPDSVVFTVRDYGPGVPRDKAKQIFQLFYRPESALTRETAGTGIGLALVQQLASAMNGEVDVVDSAPGAAFRLSFPRA